MQKSEILGPENIREIVNQYQKSRIILSAFELDIFSKTGPAGKTSEKVAQAIKCDKRATDRLMNALCAIGLLTKKENTFFNTPFSLQYFCKDSPDYMYGLMHSVNQWDTWTSPTESVKTGTSLAQRPQKINDRSEKWLESFIGAMHYRAFKSAPSVIAKIDLKNVNSVLDIGGGSAAYSMAFVNAKKGLTATVFDLQNVIPITKKFIKKEKFSGLINTSIGDYHKDDFPKGFDLIFISAVIHINTLKENEKLIKKCVKSLNHGGLLVIQDFIMDDSRTDPPSGATFALNMLVGTIAGDTYTASEVKNWFSKAGLQFDKQIALPSGNSLISGIKN